MKECSYVSSFSVVSLLLLGFSGIDLHGDLCVQAAHIRRASMSSFGLYLAVAQYLHQSCSLGKPRVGGWAFYIHGCFQVWLSLYPPPYFREQSRFERDPLPLHSAQCFTIARLNIGHSEVRLDFFLFDTLLDFVSFCHKKRSEWSFSQYNS